VKELAQPAYRIKREGKKGKKDKEEEDGREADDG
jgi:hypothetical protein